MMKAHPGPPCGPDSAAFRAARPATDGAVDDRDALRSYVDGGSAAAFATLTGRFAGLVYGAARRRTGQHELAEEVAQNVFVILARKAPALLRKQTPLAAWLHRAAVLESSEALRRESVRHRVMKAFATHQELAAPAEAGAALDSILPDLDEALDRLPRTDRELLLARYYEERSYRDLAATTGRSEAALMQQHHRALEKLSRLFHRRGHRVTATALAAGLGAPVASAAPAGLAASCAAGATASAAATISSATLFQLSLAMQTKTQLALVAVLACLATGAGAFFAARKHGAASAESQAAATQPAGGSSRDIDHAAAASASSPSSLALVLPVPTAAEVLAAEGRERLEKLALWLPGASSPEMKDMLESLSALEETMTQRTEKELILLRWVEVDRAAAFATAKKIEGNTWLACEALGRVHPREAWDEVPRLDQYEAGAVLRGIADADPSLARDLFAASDKSRFGPFGRHHEQIANGLARTDPRQGWEYAVAHGVFGMVSVGEFLRTDPEAAVAVALAQPASELRAQAISRLMEQLHRDHPEKAASLLADLPEGRVKWEVQTRHMRSLADTDPDAALAIARQAASPVARAAMMQELAASWAEHKPQEALRLLRELDWNDSGNEYLTPEVITSGAPEKSADESAAAIGPSRFLGQFNGSKAAGALSQLASHGHLEEALAVAESVPSGPQRERALGAIADGWPAERVHELSEWLMTQEAPVVRETGAFKIVLHLLGETDPDFDAAARWAATLPVSGNPESSLLVEVVQEWRKKDPAAANTALEKLAMPDAVRTVLEKPAAP